MRTKQIEVYSFRDNNWDILESLDKYMSKKNLHIRGKKIYYREMAYLTCFLTQLCPFPDDDQGQSRICTEECLKNCRISSSLVCMNPSYQNSNNYQVCFAVKEILKLSHSHRTKYKLVFALEEIICHHSTQKQQSASNSGKGWRFVHPLFIVMP